MIGEQLQAASNVLDLLRQSGDWQKDERLKQASLQLSQALERANSLPELRVAYEHAVSAYAVYIRTHEAKR